MITLTIWLFYSASDPRNTATPSTLTAVHLILNKCLLYTIDKIFHRKLRDSGLLFPNLFHTVSFYEPFSGVQNG